METSEILNSKAVKAFIKGMLVLIGLFAVLYCGIDALILILRKALEDKFCTIIFALVSPIVAFSIVFFGFSCFVKRLLFGSSGNEEVLINRQKMKILSDGFFRIVEAIKPDSVKDKEALSGLLKDMLVLISEISSEEKGNTSVKSSDSATKLLNPKQNNDSSNVDD